MKKLSILAVGLFALLLTSCTENQRVKSWGGTGSYSIEKGQKVVNVTWKNEELWILTRTMHADESAETYKFNEKSSYGMIEGTYIISETK